jgi:hypothetical protein
MGEILSRCSDNFSLQRFLWRVRLRKQRWLDLIDRSGRRLLFVHISSLCLGLIDHTRARALVITVAAGAMQTPAFTSRSPNLDQYGAIWLRDYPVEHYTGAC